MGEHVHARAEYALASFMQVPKLRIIYSRHSLAWNCDQGAIAMLHGFNSQLHDARTASSRSIYGERDRVRK